VPFKCGFPFSDKRDGKFYKTTQIGTQCWMAENLNIGLMIPGTNEMTNDGIIQKYCYSDNPSNCDIYGGLYQWNEMMQYTIQQNTQGICPSEWHLPSDSELSILTNLLESDELAGGHLKQTGTLESGSGLWHTPNSGATNDTQFTGLPAGYSKWDGTYYSLGNHSHYWSSNEASEENAILRTLFFDWPDFMLNNYSKEFGFSVRCIKD
jgi:uncharacterized protein (TIGR02145 family)